MSNDDIKTMEYLKENYLDMVSDITHETKDIYKYRKLFEELYIMEKGALVINESEIFFKYGDEKISDFGAIVLKVIKVHELEKTFFEVELLIVSEYENSKVVIINSLSLESKLWVERLGVQYIYGNNSIKKIQSIIKKMSQYAPTTQKYRYSGWLKDTKDTYIMGGRELTYISYNNQNAPRKSCEFIFDMLKIAPYRITMPMLSIALLSLVHTEMVDVGQYFRSTFILYGQTQSFKTTLATLFYDFDNGKNAHVNFNSTEAAIMRVMTGRRDLVTVVDDLKPPPTSSIKHNLVEKLKKIIRIGADDSNGYQIASKNSTIAYKPQGITVVTAEDIPINVASSLARTLILEMNRKTVEVDKLTIIQNNHCSYKRFVETYIRYISETGTSCYCGTLKDRFLQERNIFQHVLNRRDISIDNRTNDACVFLYIGFDEFLKYARKVGVLDEKGIIEYADINYRIFLEIVGSQAELINQKNEI